MMNDTYSVSPGFSSYMLLQKSLDKVLGKIGVDNTIELLESFIDNSSMETHDMEKTTLITQYIITCSIAVFNLDREQFYSSTVREYREARMVTYYLLRKYTEGSFRKIGELFNQKKRNIIYFCRKCADMLSIPQYNETFNERYITIEKQTIAFISKLN
ncbi:hypothetical protein GCM10009122_22850 [Fulvivirga kasyanovii]|nr:helix-turn-helix domain-containing protein [Fulvivirga kasyanovii]